MVTEALTDLMQGLKAKIERFSENYLPEQVKAEDQLLQVLRKYKEADFYISELSEEEQVI